MSHTTSTTNTVNKNRILGALLVLFLLILCIGYFYNKQKNSNVSQNTISNASESQTTENTLPEQGRLSLKDFEGLSLLDGSTFSTKNYEGKKVVINFWASWCPTCRSEMPELQSFYEKNKDNEKIAFLSVNLTDGKRETAEKAIAYLNEENFTFPTLSDPSYQAFSKLNLNALPITVILEENGQAAPLFTYQNTPFYAHFGAITEKMLEDYLSGMEKQGA